MASSSSYDPNFRGPVSAANPTPAERLKMQADTIRQHLQAIDQEMPLKRGFNGVPSLGLPEYSFSFAATYDLPRDSFLKGFSIGTTVRYRGTTTLAFEQSAAGVANLDRSLTAPGARDWDMFAAYRRKLWKDKIDWRVQANVKNVLNDDAPVYLTGLWDRTTQSFLYTRNLMKEPRSLIVSTTFGW